LCAAIQGQNLSHSYPADWSSLS